MSRRLDHDLLEHDAGVHHPELQHVCPGLDNACVVTVKMMLSATTRSQARSDVSAWMFTTCGGSSSNETA